MRVGTVTQQCAGPGKKKKVLPHLSVPILVGRYFADSDTATSTRVGILNEEFDGSAFFPKSESLGHQIGSDDARINDVVGVVKTQDRTSTKEPIPMAVELCADCR